MIEVLLKTTPVLSNKHLIGDRLCSTTFHDGTRDGTTARMLDEIRMRDGLPLRTIVLPCTRWVYQLTIYTQEERGLIFPRMSKGPQDDGVGVNTKWMPERVALLPTLKQTRSTAVSA